MEDRQLELDLWQSLEAASRFPERADVRSLCEALEQTLAQAMADQSLAEQLTIAGTVLAKLSEVHAARADLLIFGWERRHNPSEPIVHLDECADLFVQSLSLDVTDLFEAPDPVQYPANRKKNATQVNDSVVEDVDKGVLLNWVDQMTAAQMLDQQLDQQQMAAQIRDLAHGENGEDWSRTIAAYFANYQAQHPDQKSLIISLPALCEGMQKTCLEVWLGLLLSAGISNGIYQLCQTSDDFYDAVGIQIRWSY